MGVALMPLAPPKAPPKGTDCGVGAASALELPKLNGVVGAAPKLVEELPNADSPGLVAGAEKLNPGACAPPPKIRAGSAVAELPNENDGFIACAGWLALGFPKEICAELLLAGALPNENAGFDSV